MLVGLILGAFYQVSINESDTFVKKKKKDQADKQPLTAQFKKSMDAFRCRQDQRLEDFPQFTDKGIFALRRNSASWSRQTVGLRVGLLKLTPKTYTFCSLVRKTQWFEILTNEAAKVWQQVSGNNDTLCGSELT